jgi:hypothetical protein
MPSLKLWHETTLTSPKKSLHFHEVKGSLHGKWEQFHFSIHVRERQRILQIEYPKATSQMLKNL